MADVVCEGALAPAPAALECHGQGPRGPASHPVTGRAEAREPAPVPFLRGRPSVALDGPPARVPYLPCLDKVRGWAPACGEQRLLSSSARPGGECPAACPGVLHGRGWALPHPPALGPLAPAPDTAGLRGAEPQHLWGLNESQCQTSPGPLQVHRATQTPVSTGEGSAPRSQVTL